MNQEQDDLFVSQDTGAPTPSDAISAFIKSVRLRDTENAVMWMAYLWQFSKERGRIQRRILLESGEDNLSLDVIESISAWYGSGLRKSLEAATVEVVRLCATKNWWAQPDGRQYIYAWRQAEMVQAGFTNYSVSELLAVMRDAVVEKSLIRGLSAFNAAYARRDFAPKILAPLLLDWSEWCGGQHAMRLASVFNRHVGTFWTDNNISGQAYYALIHGKFGEQVCPEVDSEKALSILHYAVERIKAGISVPSHALDGVHTRRGADRRFAGVVKFMSGCCRAFEHYGRLLPEDEWLPSFLDLPENVH